MHNLLLKFNKTKKILNILSNRFNNCLISNIHTSFFLLMYFYYFTHCNENNHSYLKVLDNLASIFNLKMNNRVKTQDNYLAKSILK